MVGTHAVLIFVIAWMVRDNRAVEAQVLLLQAEVSEAMELADGYSLAADKARQRAAALRDERDALATEGAGLQDEIARLRRAPPTNYADCMKGLTTALQVEAFTKEQLSLAVKEADFWKTAFTHKGEETVQLRLVIETKDDQIAGILKESKKQRRVRIATMTLTHLGAFGLGWGIAEGTQ